jgi:hypothetical protein
VVHANRPVSSIPPIRVFLDATNGTSLQLIPVRGLDLLEPADDDPGQLVHLRWYLAFGPAYLWVPPIGTLRVEPESEDLRVHVQMFTDSLGWQRFKPMSPVLRTNN